MVFIISYAESFWQEYGKIRRPQTYRLTMQQLKANVEHMLSLENNVTTCIAAQIMGFMGLETVNSGYRI